FAASASPRSYTLSLHDALPIFRGDAEHAAVLAVRRQERHLDRLKPARRTGSGVGDGLFGHDLRPAAVHHRSIVAQEVLDLLLVRSEEHTSELQSRVDLVCRLLL